MTQAIRRLACLVTVLALGAPLYAQRVPEPIQDAPDRAEGKGPYDRLILRGATLIDGTGAPPAGPVDIVIEKNRIVRIRSVG